MLEFFDAPTREYYQCVEDHFERLEQVHDEIFCEAILLLPPLLKAGYLSLLGLRHPP
jgi:hypothetical protein